MRALPILFAAAYCLTAVPALSQPNPAVNEEAQTSEAGAAEDKPKKERKICRRETGTGSIMSKRVCYTPEELKALQRMTEENLRNDKR